MANLMFIVLPLALSLVILFSPAHCQITQSGCTPAMLTSFTPCMNSVSVNSTGNGVSPPTSDCCNSIKSLMSGGTDCMCLVASGSPFKIPINRTVAMSLPQACKMSSVPLQCKAAAAPIPTSGPAAFSPPLSPTASTNPGSALAPEADSTPLLTPPSSTGTATNGNTGSRPVLTPSAAGVSYQYSPALVIVILAATLLKSFY